MDSPVPKLKIKKPFTTPFDPNYENVNLLHAYGNQCKQKQHFITGVVALKRALALDPNNPDLLCDLGACLWNYGDYKGAYEVLKKSLVLRPTAVCHVNMGLTLSAMGRFLTARDHYVEALRLNPRFLDQNLCMSLGSSFHAARFALSYHVLTARSAARMDLAIGMSGSTGWGEIIANPVRSERL